MNRVLRLRSVILAVFFLLVHLVTAEVGDTNSAGARSNARLRHHASIQFPLSSRSGSCSGSGCGWAGEVPPFPNTWVWGCSTGNVSASFPFCDVTLSIDKRIDDLIDRLTLDELTALMGSSNATGVNTCDCMDNGVPRLGIPPWLNLVEVTNGVSALCVGPDRCTTSFPSAPALGATFNRSLWTYKGVVISDELRALNNVGGSRAPASNYKVGLSSYGPNINIVRDPRFGRNNELPSEDPFLAGSYAEYYIRAMQQGEDSRYLKIYAGIKHFALYTMDTNRFSFIPAVSLFDLYDTYLPQYRMALTPTSQGGAQVAAIMCSYAGFNNAPSCANHELLNEIVRQGWDRDDVLVVSDCQAIENMVDYNHYAQDDVDAAAKALNGGCDVDMGDVYYPPSGVGGNGALAIALAANLTDMAHVRQSVRRVLLPRFRLGVFDPLENQVYTNIGADVINSTAHYDVLLDAALQGLVLLKNNNNTLPFHTNKTTAVLGPHTITQQDLFPNYAGDESCYGGGYWCIRTVGEVFTTSQAAAGLGHVLTAKGVDLDSNDTTDIVNALEKAQQADQIVLMLGLGNQQEHEGMDRDNLLLPGLQELFASLVLDLNKPTVIVLINAGTVAIDNLLPRTNALIQAFYPAYRTGEAVYSSIFGLTNRWGKLPVTLYTSSFPSEQKLSNFDMTTKPGRTYRYYTNTPAFTFGFGLSYTTFSYIFNLSQPGSDAHAVASTSSGESHGHTHTTLTKTNPNIGHATHAAAASPASPLLVSLPSCDFLFPSLRVATPVSPPLQLTVDVWNTGLMAGDEILLVYHRLSDDLVRNVSHIHPVPLQSLIEFERVHLPVGGYTSITFTIPIDRLAVTAQYGTHRVIYPGIHHIIITDHVQQQQQVNITIIKQ